MIPHLSTSNSPNKKPWLIVVASSAGGVKALSTLVASLPHDLPAAVVLVQHRSPTGRSYLQEILMREAHMPVVTATSGDRISRGVVYIARPDRHLIVRPDRHFEYRDGQRIKFVMS